VMPSHENASSCAGINLGINKTDKQEPPEISS